MKTRDLDLNLLQSFEALLRERHVTRAADQLQMSQSSMSASLAKLRHLFGDEILMRGSTGLVPTEFAQALLPRVQQAIAAFDHVLEPAQFNPSTASHTLRLILIDYIDLLMLPIVMRRVRQEAPDVRLHILQTNPHHFGEMLAEGDLDLAVTYFPSPPDYLKGRKLFSDRFLGLCASDNPILDAKLDVAQFCALPHVTIEPLAAQIYNVQIDEALRPYGMSRRVQAIKPSFLTLPFMLERSDMVASVPARLARRMMRMADVKVFDLPMELPAFDVRMLWHPRTDNSPKHEWFRELVLDCARLV